MTGYANSDDLLLLLADVPQQTDTWEPAFDAGRCLVRFKLGPLERLYLRPPRFRERFYHQLYPLPVDTWDLDSRFSLFAGLCTLEVRLRIRFQATLRYVERNPGCWEDVNGSVRGQMETLVLDVVEASLSRLESGEWIETGLRPVEKQLANAINEMLTLNHIQCRTICSLVARFADVSELDRQTYLNERVVQAVVDQQTENDRLLFRTIRQQEEEALRLEVERIRFAAEGSARKQAEEVEGKKKRLEEKQRHLQEIHELEAELHRQELRHRSRLTQEALAEKNQRMQEKLRQREEIREIERKIHEETLQHRSRLEQMVMEKQRREANNRESLDAARRKTGPSPPETEATDPVGADTVGREDQLLKDLEWQAAIKLREKEELIESLEERLRKLMSSQQKGGQMAVGHAPALQTWLDRLAQLTGRLMFFFRVRK